MKFLISFWLLFAGSRVLAAEAPLRFVPAREAQEVMGSGIHSITVAWRNAGSNIVDAAIAIRLSELSSASAAPISQKLWRQLRVLPGQTIMESAPVDFPAVKSETRFLIQWIENSNRVLGKTMVLAYPTNLLAELKLLVKESGRNIGLLDPTHLLAAGLSNSAIGFVDLEAGKLDAFDGRLALIGPCDITTPEWNGLARRIGKLAQKGVAIVWILPARRMAGDISPSFYTVPQNHSAVVVAQEELVANLLEDPRSQLNLLHFCKLALNPQPAALPDLAAKSRL